MNLDKHDLFQSAIPGYVFFVVFLSFWAVTGGLDKIAQSPVTIVGLIAGFPIGFLLRTIYGLLHRCFCEQSHMGQEECDIVNRRVASQYIDEFNQRVPEGERTRTISHVLMFALSEDSNTSYRDRIEFHLSHLHALGASLVAVLVSLLLFWIVKILFPIGKTFDPNTTPWLVSLSLVWIFMIIMLHAVRRAVKESYRVSLAVFATIRRDSIEKLLSSPSGKKAGPNQATNSE